MDWLRSEDLKEEKVLTTSKLTITRQGSIYLFRIDLVTVSVRPSSCAPHAGFRLKVRNAANLLRAGEPWPRGAGQDLLARQTLPEPNKQVSPFAFEILYKIAHSISRAFRPRFILVVLAFGTKMEADESSGRQ